MNHKGPLLSMKSTLPGVFSLRQAVREFYQAAEKSPRLSKKAVIPAKAGIQTHRKEWIPVFTGMTTRDLNTLFQRPFRGQISVFGYFSSSVVFVIPVAKGDAWH
jgi:hypothetical protein